jgi:glucose-1-phosphate cytidylyltransferase
MKAVILAGGFGTRISEETALKPKPMIEIGGKPILWHIMKIYSHYGVNDFIVCCGYRGYAIKEYFANYYLHNSDLTIDMKTNRVTYANNKSEPWTVTLMDTGETTMTGGRLKRVAGHLDPKEEFCFTYGDGLSDVNIGDLLAFHRRSGKRATLTAIQPPGRYGSLMIEGQQVKAFQEKPEGDGSWVNGGFFVLSPQVIDYIEGPDTVWEREPLERLSRQNELAAFKHRGFWQPMDTLRDKTLLEHLWTSGEAPWKVWK